MKNLKKYRVSLLNQIEGYKHKLKALTELFKSLALRPRAALVGYIHRLVAKIKELVTRSTFIMLLTALLASIPTVAYAGRGEESKAVRREKWRAEREAARRDAQSPQRQGENEAGPSTGPASPSGSSGENGAGPSTGPAAPSGSSQENGADPITGPADRYFKRPSIGELEKEMRDYFSRTLRELVPPPRVAPPGRQLLMGAHPFFQNSI